MRSLSLLVLAASLLTAFSSTAEPVKIISGGPAGIAIFARIKDEVEKRSSLKVETSIIKQGAALHALRDGKIDLFLFGGDPKKVLANPLEFDVPQLDINDFQYVQFGEARINFHVHPENPITALTAQQATDILSGKIKNWKALGGFDFPIKLFVANNLKSTTLAVCSHYVNKPNCKDTEMVVDQAGLASALKANKGGFAIAGGTLKAPEFTPKILPSEAFFPMHLFTRKKTTPDALKILDAVRSIGIIRAE